MLNIITIAGRFVRKPELKSTNYDFSVVEFDLAIQQFSKGNKREAMFLKFVAYSKIAERICECCDKGDKIAVTGRLESNSYVDKNDVKRTKLQVKVETIEFMGKKDKDYSNFEESTSNESTSTEPDSQDVLEAFEKFLGE